MNPRRPRLFLIGLTLAGAALACDLLPGGVALPDTPTPGASPTVNLTLTAVFASTATQPGDPTATPTDDPDEPTSTSTPTETLIPTITRTPTITLTPTETEPVFGFTPNVPEFTPGTGEAPSFGFTPVPGLDSITGENPETRRGDSYEAQYQIIAPVIDGDLSDWEGELYSTDAVVFGQSYHSGASDLFSVFQMGWDEDNFYIGATVDDNRFVQEADGDQLFRGDSVEFLLDTDVMVDYYDDEADEDDYQIGISPGSSFSSGTPENYLWVPETLSGSQDGVEVGVMASDDGYVIEIAIPWEVFNVTAIENQHFGFAFSVSDNDKPDTVQQQTLISSAPRRHYNDPTTWLDLVLVK